MLKSNIRMHVKKSNIAQDRRVASIPESSDGISEDPIKPDMDFPLEFNLKKPKNKYSAKQNRVQIRVF